LAFRYQFPSVSWTRDQCRVVDENATIDNVHCVKIQRVIVQKDFPQATRVESLWVSPVRGDVVVHWAIQNPPDDWEGAIKYRKDPKCGWAPSEWTSDSKDSHRECRVTDYAINEKIDPAVFSQKFPPGTPVQDQRADTPEGVRHHVVQADGSQRAITNAEYLQMIGVKIAWPRRAKAPAN
jgi:hypothetical protein